MYFKFLHRPGKRLHNTEHLWHWNRINFFRKTKNSYENKCDRSNYLFVAVVCMLCGGTGIYILKLNIIFTAIYLQNEIDCHSSEKIGSINPKLSFPPPPSTLRVKNWETWPSVFRASAAVVTLLLRIS